MREAWHILEPTTPYVHSWHHDALAAHLEAVTRREITRLEVNQPPGTMKSLQASVMWPAWEWGPAGMAGLRYLTTSYTETYARRDSRRMRDLVTSEWYRERWPSVVLDRDNEVDFENTAKGGRRAMPFASLTAGRGNRVVIDDPHSTEQVESDADRSRAARIFRESVPSRLNDARTDAIVVIMHRLHPRDVCGVIEEYGMDYVKVILPMEYEAKRALATRWFRDPRREEGELLCPERVDAAAVAKLKGGEMTSHAYATQYQQRTSAREGGLFKRHWFRYVDAIPAEASRKVRRWDLAATEEGENRAAAWTAGVLLSTANDGRFYIEDVQRMRASPNGVRQAIRGTAEQDGRGVEVGVPQDPGQAGKAQAQSLVGMLAGFRCYAEIETGDKETRAEPLAAQAEAGNVYLLRGSWNTAFVDELCAFPQGFADQVDAAAGAFNRVAGIKKIKVGPGALARSRQAPAQSVAAGGVPKTPVAGARRFGAAIARSRLRA